MTFKYAYSVIHGFVIAHQFVTLVGIVTLGFLWWKKREMFYTCIFIILGLMTVYYIFTVSSGALETEIGGEKDFIRAPKTKKSND